MRACDRDAHMAPTRPAIEAGQNRVERGGREVLVRANEIVGVHLLPCSASLAFHNDKIIRFASVCERGDRAMKSASSHCAWSSCPLRRVHQAHERFLLQGSILFSYCSHTSNAPKRQGGRDL